MVRKPMEGYIASDMLDQYADPHTGGIHVIINKTPEPCSELIIIGTPGQLTEGIINDYKLTVAHLQDYIQKLENGTHVQKTQSRIDELEASNGDLRGLIEELKSDKELLKQMVHRLINE